MKIDEYVKYENIHKYTGKRKFLLFFGWLFIICGILVLVTNIVTKKKKRAKAEEKIREDKENKPTLYTGVLPPKAKKKERK